MLVFGVDTGSTGAVAEIETRSSPSSDAVVNEPNIIREKLRRINKLGKADELVNDVNEERAGGIVSKLSNLLDTFPDKFLNKYHLMDRWAEAGKSDDFVKKQLKLRGLSGDALKAHKNYNYFERFEGRRDVIRLERWMTTEASTYSVWTQQGLGYINTWDDLKKAMDTDAFKLYMSYGKYFDTIAHLNMAIKPVPVIGSDASWMEKVVRILSWKHTDKPEEYVMKILGFDKFSLETLQANKHGETFLLFWLLKNERVDRLYMKELLEKLVEFEKLSPAEMTKLKNKDSLETAQENTKTLLKKLLGLNDLSKEEMVLHDKYHTYKYLSGLIKRQTIDKHISILMERLTPRY